MIQDIEIAKVRLDGDTQSRVAIDQDTVAEYAEALMEGAVMPPVVVMFDGTDHWLADGFHRLLGNKRMGAIYVSADVRPGTARDAQMYAFAANVTHGLRRTNADKRKAVEGMLALVPDWSDRAIAKHCGVAHPMVAAVRNPEAKDRQNRARVESDSKREVESDSSGRVESDSTLPAAEPPAKQADREPGPVRAGAEAPEQPDMGEFDPVAELEKQMAVNASLQAQVTAAAADDLKAEVMKWRRAYEHAQRTADEKMANAARLDKELQQLHNRMLRIGKLFNERDPMKIPALVEAFYRAHAKVAA